MSGQENKQPQDFTNGREKAGAKVEGERKLCQKGTNGYLGKRQFLHTAGEERASDQESQGFFVMEKPRPNDLLLSHLITGLITGRTAAGGFRLITELALTLPQTK